MKPEGRALLEGQAEGLLRREEIGWLMCFWALVEPEGGGERSNGWGETSWCLPEVRAELASHTRWRCEVSWEGLGLEK